MKKSIFMCLMALAIMFGFNSCKSVKFGLVYNVEITGSGDGDFRVDFPEGHYSMNGTADLELQVGDTVPFKQVTSKSTVIEKNKKKELATMRKANESVMKDFTATAASGTYDVLIDGTVTEIGTGLTFAIHKRLTNRQDSTKVLHKTDKEFDEFEFIR